MALDLARWQLGVTTVCHADGRLAPTALAVLALTPLAAAELVGGLPDAAARLADAVPATRRLAALESAPAPVVDPARPAAVPADPTVAAEAKAVRWPDASHEAVSGVSFLLPPGERMVLAGPSGAAKSTVLAAIPRTLPTARGTVTPGRVRRVPRPARRRDRSSRGPRRDRPTTTGCGPHGRTAPLTPSRGAPPCPPRPNPGRTPPPHPPSTATWSSG
jgi:hypothetical protein